MYHEIKASYLSMMEINAIHGEFLGVLQEVDLGLGRTHAPGHSS